MSWWEAYAGTDRQRTIMRMHEAGSSFEEIAAAIGVVDTRNIRRDIKAIRLRASLKGEGPHFVSSQPVSEAERLAGTSTLYGADGAPKLQWVKTKPDDAKRLQMIEAMVEGLKEDLPRQPPSPPPAGSRSEDLVNAYVLSDYHLGMLAWGDEAGADWDLSIAEELLVRWFRAVIEKSPDAETGVFVQLGDFLHFDSLSPVTPTSGHLLDADTRFTKIVRVMVKTIRVIIDLLLSKHDRVVVLMAEGNHDLASSVMMREFLSAMYELEPRVEVETSPKPYYSYAFGDVMLCAHHGHLSKNRNLPLIFASNFAEQWGSTKYRYAHTGHRHHKELKEHSGMTVEQHPTLAAKDAYAARHGYHAHRCAHAITYHRSLGEVGRITMGPEAVL